MMDCSSNEMQSLFYKACVGSGLSTGLAQICARAGILLSQQNFDGPNALLAALQYFNDTPDTVLPDFDGSNSISFQSLCVARQAASIFDLACANGGEFHADISQTSGLHLLVGIAGVLGRDFGLCSRFTVGGILMAEASPEQITINGLLPANAKDIIIQCGTCSASISSNHSRKIRINISDESRIKLLKLAHNTYVPASKSSRESGAGAGLVDND